MSTISDSFNNSKLDQTNIQGEQSIEINYGIDAKLFYELINEINNSAVNEDDRDKALLYAEQLKGALETKNKEKARKTLFWIREIVGDVAALMTIGTTLGVF